jgi:hypothetical protein
MKSTRSSLIPHRVASYCDLRLAPVLEPEEASTVRECLAGLLDRNEYPPYKRWVRRRRWWGSWRGR